MQGYDKYFQDKSNNEFRARIFSRDAISNKVAYERSKSFEDLYDVKDFTISIKSYLTKFITENTLEIYYDASTPK